MSVVCALYYCSVVPSPDQSLYDYIAWQGIKGIPWYSGSVDVSWPGPFLIEDLGIRAFGVQRWTARLTDFLVLQPAMVGMFFFLRSAGLRYAALAIAIVYPVIYVTAGGWQAGHRDIVGMKFLIASGRAAARRPLALARMLAGGHRARLCGDAAADLPGAGAVPAGGGAAAAVRAARRDPRVACRSRSARCWCRWRLRWPG